jgi:hypothetical protein
MASRPIASTSADRQHQRRGGHGYRAGGDGRSEVVHHIPAAVARDGQHRHVGEPAGDPLVAVADGDIAGGADQLVEGVVGGDVDPASLVAGAFRRGEPGAGEIEAGGAADADLVVAETIDGEMGAGMGGVGVAVDAVVAREPAFTPGEAGVRTGVGEAGEVAFGDDIVEPDHGGMGAAGQHEGGAGE